MNFPNALNVYDTSGVKHFDIKHDTDYVHIHSYDNTNFHFNSDLNIPTKYTGETGFVNVAQELQNLKDLINSISLVNAVYEWTHLGSATISGSIVNASTWFSFNKSLASNKRLVFNSNFLTQAYNEMNNWDDLHFGFKADDWTNTNTSNYYNSSGDGMFLNLKIRLYKNGSSNSLILAITKNGNSHNGYYNINPSQLSNSSAFIEITDDGDRISMGISNDTTNDANTVSYNNWSDIKYTDFSVNRNLLSKDLRVYWQRSSGTAGNFDYSNISLPNEIDAP